MRQLTLVRAFMTDTVTMGMLKADGIDHPPIFSLELPWKGNRPNVSCIPTGIYRCGPYSGARFKDVFHVKDVPGRSAILIHAGNRTADIEGCILPGLSAGKLHNDPAVLESAKAMDALRFILGDEPFQLTITQP